MRRRSARSRSPLILGMREHPLRDGEKLVVGMAQTDQLDAERQALVAGAERQRDAGRARQRPDRVEARIAGELLPLRRFARALGQISTSKLSNSESTCALNATVLCCA